MKEFDANAIKAAYEKREETEEVRVIVDLMQKVKHECNFNNPNNFNPVEMVNWILADYFGKQEAK